MEDAGQLAYLRASVRECGFDKKMRANPARCGTLDRSGVAIYQAVGLVHGRFVFVLPLDLGHGQALKRKGVAYIPDIRTAPNGFSFQDSTVVI